MANRKPNKPITIEIAPASAIACTAALAASCGLFSPILRETMAVVAILIPMAIAYTKKITDSVIPTVAMALILTLETKKTSTTANRDSMTISKTIGTLSKNTARFIDPVVKFFSVPAMAFFSKEKNSLIL